MSKSKIHEEASSFGSMGGRANVKKHGIDGPKGMRARGKKGAKAKWAKVRAAKASV